MITTNKLKKIEIFYEVRGAAITPIDIISTSHYTDSSSRNNLVEFFYKDFGERSVNMVVNLVEDSFEMRFEDRFVTTSIRRAIKTALKAYKAICESGAIYVPSIYYKEYFDEYPELFV